MFYDIFEDLCREKQTNPAQVRKDLNISQSTMASWKSRGLTPNATTLVQLAEYFYTTPAYLMGNKQAKNPTNRIIDDKSAIVSHMYPDAVKSDEDGKYSIYLKGPYKDPKNIPPDELAEFIKNGEIILAENGVPKWNLAADKIPANEDVQGGYLMEKFSCLNERGKFKVIGLAEDLGKIPDYQKEKTLSQRDEKSNP